MNHSIHQYNFPISSGQSVVELIVAVAIFAMIAATSVTAILSSFSTTRLAQEETQASLLAVEGLEAVGSIRNQDWANLSNGNYGLSKSGNTWSLLGTSDTTGKYNRVVVVAEVRRDANRDISLTGAVDSETKQIAATVTWNFTPTRQNMVEMVSYLTNWQAGRDTVTSPAPTPTPTTCAQACIGSGYSSGTCRQNVQNCNNSGETYLPAGDALCTGGPNADTCCCAP